MSRLMTWTSCSALEPRDSKLSIHWSYTRSSAVKMRSKLSLEFWNLMKTLYTHSDLVWKNDESVSNSSFEPYGIMNMRQSLYIWSKDLSFLNLPFWSWLDPPVPVQHVEDSVLGVKWLVFLRQILIHFVICGAEVVNVGFVRGRT